MNEWCCVWIRLNCFLGVWKSGWKTGTSFWYFAKTKNAIVVVILWLDNRTMYKELTFCPIPRSKTFPATRPRLEAHPHLISRRTNVARLLITTEQNWIFTISNNIKTTKSLSSSADQHILVFARWCPGHVKAWVKMNMKPVPRVHTDPPYAGLKWTVVFWIARWFYCARLSDCLKNSTLAFSCVEQTIYLKLWRLRSENYSQRRSNKECRVGRGKGEGGLLHALPCRHHVD